MSKPLNQLVNQFHNMKLHGNIGKKHSDEHKQKVSETLKHLYATGQMKQPSLYGKDNHFYGKTHSNESLERMSKIKLGKKYSDITKQKLSELVKNGKIGTLGKSMSEETKLKIRISKLKRMEDLGIGGCEDKGAKEYLQWLNMYYDYKFEPKVFMDIGYRADGYDEQKHTWLEYDTKYHSGLKQRNADEIRQNNIIQYFKNIGRPLNAFYRVNATSGAAKEMVDVLKGQ